MAVQEIVYGSSHRDRFGSWHFVEELGNVGMRKERVEADRRIHHLGDWMK